jgi:guanylate kinase
MIADGEFLEHACVYGQHKGIPKAHVRKALASGKDVVMRVDVQGARTVKGLLPAATTIFLTCESQQELIARLRERRTEPEEALRERLKTARCEMACIPEFDYVVVNQRDALDQAVDDVAAIIRAEQCRSQRKRVEL